MASFSPRSSFRIVLAMIAMVALPAALTLHTARVPASVAASVLNPSSHGYTVSLLLFVVPIVVVGLWFLPQEGVPIARKAFLITIALLFPLGALMDFFLQVPSSPSPTPTRRSASAPRRSTAACLSRSTSST